MPVKFDDLNKTAKSVLNDDYKVSGNEFKAKQKVACGAVLTTTVDLKPKGKDAVCTPATVSLKLPSPMGLKGLNIDKLEYNAGGNYKLECAVDKSLHKVDGLAVDIKSDLTDLAKVSKGLTFTGIKDTQVKLELKPLDPSNFTFELTRDQGPMTVGLKCGKANATQPDVGVRLTQSGVFASVLATGGFKKFEAMAQYKVDKIDLAASATKGDKGVDFVVGLGYKHDGKSSLKAKVTDKGAASATVKYSPSAGVTFLGGASYSKNGQSFGFSCQIE
jgi:hypothetical protein